MQLLYVLVIIALFLVIIWLLGNTVFCGQKRDTVDELLIGFFIYFSFFELVAFPLIMMLRPLSQLVSLWIGIVVVFCTGAIVFLVRKKRFTCIQVSDVHECFTPACICMVVFFLIQMYYMLANSQNGWDAASYIANVVQAIDTDTMFVYMEGNGLKSPNIYVRYAISTFYMHDAVLAKFFNIHGAIICRWFNTIVCNIFSALIVYKIAIVLFKNRTVAYKAVCAWIIANFGVGTIYFANQFLMTRAYEGKAFCCNVLIPAVLLYFIRIFKDPDEKYNWMGLFWVNMASVALSSSALAVIPVLNGCLFIGHLVISKRFKDIWKMVICILPSVLYFVVYALCQYAGFKVIIP